MVVIKVLIFVVYVGAVHAALFVRNIIKEKECPSNVNKADCEEIMKQLNIVERYKRQIIATGAFRSNSRHNLSTGCPVITNEYLATHNVIGQRSISPYYVEEIDDSNMWPRRFPNATCLCKGCIDTTTGRENLKLQSKEIWARINVYKRTFPNTAFRKVLVPFVVGCTCLFS